MSRKPRYVKLRLEIDLQMTDNFFQILQSPVAFKEFVLRNAFHNNGRRVRYAQIDEIPEIEYLAK